jgi:hypothetical protein
MNMYNSTTVKFPTRRRNNKGTLTDNMFLDYMRRNNCYSVYPTENGLLDHDAQILVSRNVKIQFQQITKKN